MSSSICLSVFPTSKTLAPAPSISKSCGFRCFLVVSVSVSKGHQRAMGKRLQVICMAPEEEKLTRRNPLEFPIEWERPKPSRKPDIFPQFSPMKTPLPPPMPYDPPEEDEEEEEKKEEEEEEEDPDKEEESDNPPEKQS
ncbi:putative Serine/threonine-protein kinase PBS1 [Hibiscus syriacus]|uniref:Serine/threonine-protein kinase PBS1 n=1 Tax=Hibiscus syriacus TaxID=106335 RepID=A0A6A2Y4T3_HIBSY|nr:protein Shroom4-like [Hibiscus syriacus]KAE8665377.1 putative Serine/threonine-protein kinase PBS1 [Hibiscus syriacus]